MSRQRHHHSVFLCQGFTLLEIQMALLILSVLMMIALPVYQDYRTRAKVSEGIALATRAKNGIVEFHQITGRFPATNAEAALPPPNTPQGNYIRSIEIVSAPREGSILIVYDSDLIPALGSDNTLIFAPSLNGRMLTWDCTFGTLHEEFRPRICKS